MRNRYPVMPLGGALLQRPDLLGQVRLAQGMPGMPAGSPADQLQETGAVVDVTIMKPSAGGGGTPVTIKAMIDTGASISTIQDSVAQRAGLQQTGSTQLSGVGGVQMSPIYAASLAIPQFGVTVPALEIASITNPFPGVEMLVGRDILRQLARLDYRGAGGAFVLENSPTEPLATPTPLPAGAPAPEAGGGPSTTTLLVGGGALAAAGVGALFLTGVL